MHAGRRRVGRVAAAAFAVIAGVMVVLGVVPSTPVTAGDGVRPAPPDDPVVREIWKIQDRYVELWNANRLDELVAVHWTDDAIMLPPNHEPIRGRAAILAYIKGIRDVAGEFDRGDYLIRATRSGDNAVSWVGQYSLRGGKLRITSHELYVRQADGSMRNAVDMFGYRDPMR